jgi:hypothetical protein
VALIFLALLSLHLLAVLVSYGPALVLPYLHSPPAWAKSVVDRVSFPATLTIPLTGVGMLIVAGLNPATKFWLWFSILLYGGTLAYLLFRQRPLVARLLRGDRSADVLSAGQRGSLVILLTIVSIGALMIFKPIP